MFTIALPVVLFIKVIFSPDLKQKKINAQSSFKVYTFEIKSILKLDGSLPANPVNDRRIANAVTLKSTFCLP